MTTNHRQTEDNIILKDPALPHPLSTTRETDRERERQTERERERDTRMLISGAATLHSETKSDAGDGSRLQWRNGYSVMR